MLPFVHESLLWWGLPLVGLPILIHLINMMRHRRVQWAAMEFLLQSQRRNRTWIRFKQLLLLLLRMAAVAFVVLMVAQPLLHDQWGAMFGGHRTHHVVLLDDSFSMSDRWAATSAFDEARRVIERLGAQAAHQDSRQWFTLMRFSRVGRQAQKGPPDLLQEQVAADFGDRLSTLLTSLNASQTTAGPLEALQAVEHLPGSSEDEHRIVYIVSDFRSREWNEPATLRKALDRLQETGAQIQLINCVPEAHANLAITALRPAPGTRAAGVPLFVDVAVHNYGTVEAKEVSVSLAEDDSPRPAVVFESIPAGKTVSRRFTVQFATAGEHEVAAHLPTDSVATDNARYAVIDIRDTADVLIIDGDGRAQDAFFIASALAPGGTVRSGVRPVVETPQFLRNHPLSDYEAIYLLNVPRLDQSAIDALEAYVRAGGGVAFFLGELCRADEYNQRLHRDGRGLFPLPLVGPTELLVDRLEQAPDLEVTDHPIFSIFSGERNSFLGTVTFDRYFAAPKEWVPDPDSSTQVIARLRNKSPLVVERKFGDGRVLAFLSKAGPIATPAGTWNNWGRNNPSYVVMLLETQAYLSAPRHPDASYVVGSPLEVRFDPARFEPRVRFSFPQDGAAGALTVDATQAPPNLTAVLADTGASGVYKAELTAKDGATQVRSYAFDVVPEEGDLKKLDGPALAARLKGIRYQYHDAGELRYDPQQLAGFNLSESLLFILLGVLFFEQLLAFACSYHPRAGRRAR